VTRHNAVTALVDYYQFVMSDYFKTMRIPIVAGRGFDAIDTASEGRVVIINETLANRLWKGRDPIGQRLRWSQSVGARSAFASQSARRAATSLRSSRSRGWSSCQSVLPRDLRVRLA
jgi:hypothetical protein